MFFAGDLIDIKANFDAKRSWVYYNFSTYSRVTRRYWRPQHTCTILSAITLPVSSHLNTFSLSLCLVTCKLLKHCETQPITPTFIVYFTFEFLHFICIANITIQLNMAFYNLLLFHVYILPIKLDYKLPGVRETYLEILLHTN